MVLFDSLRAAMAVFVTLAVSVCLAQQPGDRSSISLLAEAAMLSEPAIGSWPVGAAPEQHTTSITDAGSMHSVLARLSEAEATIAGLQAELQQQRDTQHLFGTIVERWQRLADPELELFNYHTHSATLGDTSSPNWYDRLSLRGYTQFRLNQSIWEDDDSAPPHHVGDRSVRANQNFLIRRARLILAGDVSEHMYVYLQPDFAATTPGSPDGTHYLQIRDWYADTANTTAIFSDSSSRSITRDRQRNH